MRTCSGNDMVLFITGGTYIGTHWRSGQIWCTVGYRGVEWWIMSAHCMRSQKGRAQQIKVCYLLQVVFNSIVCVAYWHRNMCL